MAAVLRERGMRLQYHILKRGTAGSRVNFVHPEDAGGVLIEPIEPIEATKPNGTGQTEWK